MPQTEPPFPSFPPIRDVDANSMVRLADLAPLVQLLLNGGQGVAQFELPMADRLIYRLILARATAQQNARLLRWLTTNGRFGAADAAQILADFEEFEAAPAAPAPPEPPPTPQEVAP